MAGCVSQAGPARLAARPAPASCAAPGVLQLHEATGAGQQPSPTIQGLQTDGAEPRGAFACDSSTGRGLDFLEASKLPVNASIIFPLLIFVVVWLLQKWPVRFKTAPDEET